MAAIPLNRPEIHDFLLPAAQSASQRPRGAKVSTIRQQPAPGAQAAWARTLASIPAPTVDDLLRLDDPAYWLQHLSTDQLVPAQFLREQDFLSRNLGGWAPIYFGVMALSERGADPLLSQLEILVDYGASVNTFEACSEQVASRVEEELGLAPEALWPAMLALLESRPPEAAVNVDVAMDHAARLYRRIREGRTSRPVGDGALPQVMWLDELRFWLVEIELQRRAADAEGDERQATAIDYWQAGLEAESGLALILKAEYIVGRHRRSTVLIAPELGLVLKQPGPEPFHEIALAAREHAGQPENWPRLTRGGALVTPRGRVRLTLEEGTVPRLYNVLGHATTFHSFLGITLEPFVHGLTTQAWVLREPDALSPALYETYVLHQLVAEAIGVENGDWHAANFVRRPDGVIVHVDWGAARPLRLDELTSTGRRARLEQVRNIGYSFHDESLAARTAALHGALVADETRLGTLRRRAAAIAGGEDSAFAAATVKLERRSGAHK